MNKIEINYIGKYNDDFSKLQPYFEEFESNLKEWYPLGEDLFYISHGNNYFAFFNRLGEPHYIIIIDPNDKKIIGTMIGIKRLIKNKNNLLTELWYICDLKIDKKYQGRHLSLKIFQKALSISPMKKFYSVSMYPTCKKIMKLLNYLKYLGIKSYGYLNIYSFNYDEMIDMQTLLEKNWKNICYVDLSKKKDIILKSSGKSMKLLHLQHDLVKKSSDVCQDQDQDEIIYKKPQKDYVHMFCLHENNVLNEKIKKYFKIDEKDIAKALIIGYQMNDYNFDFILTSDI